MQQFEKWVSGKDNSDNLIIRHILIQTISWQAVMRNPVVAYSYE